MGNPENTEWRGAGAAGEREAVSDQYTTKNARVYVRAGAAHNNARVSCTNAPGHELEACDGRSRPMGAIGGSVQPQCISCPQALFSPTPVPSSPPNALSIPLPRHYSPHGGKLTRSDSWIILRTSSRFGSKPIARIAT